MKDRLGCRRTGSCPAAGGKFNTELEAQFVITERGGRIVCLAEIQHGYGEHFVRHV